MQKKEIFNIAKELILISGKYSKIQNKDEKNKILKIFEKYEQKLNKQNTKYSKTILSFLLDLKNDLLSGRELNIDNLDTDEYLENYLIVKRELKYYNSLILIDSYKKFFDNFRKIKNVDKNELKKIISNFEKNYKKINPKLIAKNLLIFTSFERIFPKKYLINLYNFSKQKEILDLIYTFEDLLLKIKNFGIYFYKKGEINYKYIGFTNINGKSVLNDKIINCSKIKDRTGIVKYEYKKLILKL